MQPTIITENTKADELFVDNHVERAKLPWGVHVTLNVKRLKWDKWSHFGFKTYVMPNTFRRYVQG